MTFSDFGLNIECNAFQNVTKIIGNGAEWAVKHMPENSVVFVVDEFGSTICFVRTTGKAQLTDTYINAEGDADYQLIGAWISEYLEEHDFQKVGIIVETSSDVHQVVANNSITRKENETMKKTNLDAVKKFIAENGALEFIFIDWLEAVANAYGIDSDALEAIVKDGHCDENEYGYEDLVSFIRDGMDEFETFEALFDEVLAGGMNYENAKYFLENVGEYMSDSDIEYVKKSYEPECFVN